MDDPSCVPRESAWRGVCSVLCRGPYLAAMVTLSGGIGFGYALLLAGLPLQTLQPWVLQFLTLEQAVFAMIMGVLISLVIVLSIFSFVRRLPRVSPSGPGARSWVSVLVGLASSALCCTPVVPALLALFLSGASLVSVSAPIQYYLGTYAVVLYAAATLGMAWSVRGLARRISCPECSGPIEARTRASD
jgi:hypothetical protein